VFIVEEDKQGKGGKVVRQQFVRLGERRGDFVAVTDGIPEGVTIVSTGVFKAAQRSAGGVDNRLAPEFRLAPAPKNDCTDEYHRPVHPPPRPALVVTC